MWQVVLTGVVFGGFSCAFLHYFEINQKWFLKRGPWFMIGLCCFLAGIGLPILHDAVNGNSPDENGLLGLAFAALFLCSVEISVAPDRDLPLAPVILRFLRQTEIIQESGSENEGSKNEVGDDA
ncbi:SesA protein [Corchorus olitorius]|uniref:SesA protein n=1 Tax=Corchorus olitorius TaxID=93759 RepID=A0A1R3IZR5_9ROSI|nr:SesA protein [Corchorus olitorius]